MIPKKSGGSRPIVNLKALNSFVKHEKFKLENLEALKPLIRKGDWLVKIDFQDAYFTFPLHQDHRKYIRLVWAGHRYEFTCIAFGLSSAPWLFTKLLRPVISLLRERGVRTVIYLDDIIILHEDYLCLISQTQQIVEYFTALDFNIS